MRHGRFDGHQAGLDRGVDLAVAGLGAGDLADGAAELVGVDEIDGADGADGVAGDCIRLHDGAQADAGENDQLGAGVVAIHIVGGVGFGKAGLLRPGEGFGKRDAFALQLGEDVVAGAVEDAADLVETIAGEAFLQGVDDGNAAGDRGPEGKSSAVLAGQGRELRTVLGDELFVGSDDGFTGSQRT